MVDLAASFPVEGGRTDALDAFVSACLCDAGVWATPRESDGIPTVDRVLERGPARLRVCARIYTIDQTLHPFWLEVERDPSGERATWILYLDVVERSERQAQRALATCDRPEDLAWRVILAGEAAPLGGSLRPVPGSTRALVRDAD